MFLKSRDKYESNYALVYPTLDIAKISPMPSILNYYNKIDKVAYIWKNYLIFRKPIVRYYDPLQSVILIHYYQIRTINQ